MRQRPRPRLASALCGAIFLGAATVLLPKARADDHWSVSPKIEIVVEVESGADGEPFDLPGFTTGLLPALL
jgi:hypothetical protein